MSNNANLEMSNVLYSDLSYKAYMKSVEESQILTSKNTVKIGKDESELLHILNDSQELAREHFVNNHELVVRIMERINSLEKSLINDTQTIKSARSQYEDMWNNIFDDFNNSLNLIFSLTQEKLIESFTKKLKRLENFSICLFGRTKSGKSTTMEAFTSGDGSTIGKGFQNTTQTNKEYFWNGLIITDTPGIDAWENSKEYENEALSFADESDMIVFLMPHQIEEGDLEKFDRFYKLNKPIIILLNIKKNIGNKSDTNFDLFLKNPEKEVFIQKDIDGYKSRIIEYIFQKLNIKENIIPILAVHSASAFLSRNEENENLKDKLYKASRFQDLEYLLINEIKENGIVYRIKNPYDTINLFSNIAQQGFNEFHDKLSKQQLIFKENLLNFKDLKLRVRSKRNDIIKKNISRYFDNKISSINKLIADIYDAGKDEIKRNNLIKGFINENYVKSLIEQSKNEIEETIKKEIKKFFENFKEKMTEFYSSNLQSNQFNEKVNSDLTSINSFKTTSSIFTGVSAATGIIGSIGGAIIATEITIGTLSTGAIGTLFGIGGANIWNPVGWTLIGLGILTTAFSFIFGSKQKNKIKEAKLEAEIKFKEGLEKQKKEISDALYSWSEKIIENIQYQHINVMEQYVKYIDKHLNEVKDLSEFLKDLENQNRFKKFEEMIKYIADNDTIKILSIVDSIDKTEIKIKCNEQLYFKTIEDKLKKAESKQILIKGVFK
jgi:hypothetical protein